MGKVPGTGKGRGMGTHLLDYGQTCPCNARHINRHKVNACESCGQDTVRRRRCPWCGLRNCTHCSRWDTYGRVIKHKCRSCH